MKRHPVNEVLRTISDYFGVSVADIRSKRRTRDIHPARVWGMYLASEITGSSFEEIGHKFGGRDHAIVRMAARCRRSQVALDAESARLYDALRAHHFARTLQSS